MAEDWTLEGTYMEACNCKEACPCVFLSPPSEGECTALVAWRIDSGQMGDVDLSGRTAVMAAHAPTTMIEGNWTAALYLDDEASDEQRDALLSILSGRAGGHPARLAEFVGEMLGVRSVPLSFQSDGDHHELHIGEVGEARINAEHGEDDEHVTIQKAPFSITPGHPLVLARSEHLRYRDYDYDWELSDRNGFFAPFSYAGPTG